MPLNTILAIWHSSNRGKSQTIKSFAQFLLQNTNLNPTILLDDPNLNHPTNDFMIVVTLNTGSIVGITSQGDPQSGLQSRLADLATIHNCNVLICSTRIRGTTVREVENIANTHNYDIIWTSTYQTGFNHGLINQIKGEHMLDLLLRTGRI